MTYNMVYVPSSKQISSIAFKMESRYLPPLHEKNVLITSLVYYKERQKVINILKSVNC